MLLFVILYLEHPFFIVLHFNQFLKTEVKHDYDLPVDPSVLLLSATGRRADETSPVHVCRRSGKCVLQHSAPPVSNSSFFPPAIVRCLLACDADMYVAVGPGEKNGRASV